MPLSNMSSFLGDLFLTNFKVLYRGAVFLNLLYHQTLNHSDLTLFDFCKTVVPVKYPETRAIILLNSCNIEGLLEYYQKPDSYIIFYRQINELESMLNTYISSPSWNPNAKFIFVSRDFSINEGSVLSRFFKEYFITKFIICNINPDKWKMNVYGWDELNLSKIYYRETVELDLLMSFDMRKEYRLDVDLFPMKYFADYNFMVCKFVPVYIPPFLIRNGTYPGIEHRILSAIEEKLNFTMEYHHTSYPNWGVSVNGNFTDNYGVLQRREAHAVIGRIRPTAEVCQYFTCYWTNYYFENMRWVVPVALNIPEKQTLKLVFTPQIWQAFFVIILVCLIFWFILDKDRTVLTPWGIILSNAVHLTHSQPSLRVLFIVILFFNLIFSSSFQSQLINAIAYPQKGYQINSQEEIYSSMEYGLHPTVRKTLFSDNTTTYLAEKAEDCPLDLSCMNRSAFQRNFATTISKTEWNYLVPNYYVDENGESMLYLVDKPLYWFPLAIVFTKGLPFFPNINRVLMRLTEGGLIKKLTRELDELNWSLAVRKWRGPLIDVTLNVDQLMGSFIILGIGYVISGIVFLAEICILL